MFLEKLDEEISPFVLISFASFLIHIFFLSSLFSFPSFFFYVFFLSRLFSIFVFFLSRLFAFLLTNPHYLDGPAQTAWTRVKLVTFKLTHHPKSMRPYSQDLFKFGIFSSSSVVMLHVPLDILLRTRKDRIIWQCKMIKIGSCHHSTSFGINFFWNQVVQYYFATSEKWTF